MRLLCYSFLLGLAALLCAPHVRAQVPTAPAQTPSLVNAPGPRSELTRSGGGPEPDTTDWHRYFPLAQGNAWQYRAYVYNDMGEEGGFYYSRDVIGDSLIDGQLWWVLRGCTRPLNGSSPSCGGREFVRYDDENRMLLKRGEDSNSNPSIGWWGTVPCRLDAPFNSSVECTGPGTFGKSFYVYGGHNFTLVLPPDEVEDVTVKGYVTEGTEVTTEVVAGIGVVYNSGEASADFRALIWTRVGELEYGTRVFVFPTGSEEAPPVAEALRLEVWPNPSRGAVSVALTLDRSQPVELEVVDVLGRVVVRRDLGALPVGRHEVALDGGAWGAGTYLVRVEAGARRATERISLVR